MPVQSASSAARLGLSQSVFAQSLGVSKVLVQGWEQGRGSHRPSPRRLAMDVYTIANPDAWMASLPRRAG